ncbi:MAG TPA: protein kinase [Thermoanaerobaculia bacterium]|nr:protein kinase [Thermoanaerobaculia bacterium]
MPSPREEDFRGTERFQIEKRLGSGAFGVVYQAWDRELGRRVALKTLRPSGDEAVYRFKREFRALADLTHPNLVTLYELASEGDQWFFTMELIEGINFLDYIRGRSYATPESLEPPIAAEGPASADSPTAPAEARISGTSAIDSAGRVLSTHMPGACLPPDIGRLRSALRQAVSGIRALHEAGKLHRDIKPMNVLVTKTGRVVLLDFGLVTELDPEDVERSLELVGTPAYMSPEQGTSTPISEASDWYSLGVMLYEALTGRRPFVGSFADMLLAKQDESPPAPRDLSPTIPEDLNQLCQDLLRHDPRERPAGEEISQRLGEEKTESALDDTVSTTIHAAAPFIGREGELQSLRDAFSATQGARAVEVHVHGTSGIGKTALIRHFLQELRWSDAAIILTGRCYERESVPFKALDSLIDALSRYLKGLSPAEVETVLPQDVPALIRLFPVLRRVEAVATARRRTVEIPDSQELRRRGFAAVRELLGRLASQKPVVLFIDDLHWGDVDSALLLSEVLRPPDAPAVLLVLAYRIEEAETSPLLRKLLTERDRPPDVREIPVRELPLREAKELAYALLLGGAPASRAQADEIARESAGSPFFIDELARYARAEADLLEPAKPLEATTVDSVVHARISHLPEDARRALELVAVAGRPIEVAVLREAASPEIGPHAISILRAGRLIRARRTADRDEIEPYHDRVRQTVLAHVAAEALREDHLRLALAWEASRRADPETLMLHFQEAGQIEKAAEYAVTAAAQASSALAFDRAARLYSVAFELGSEKDPEARRRLRALQAQALANAGRGAEAGKAYLGAMEGAPAAEALELQRRAAEQFLRSGHLHDGVAVLRSLLAKIGMELAETPRQALLSLVLRRARVALRGLSFRERDQTQISAEELMRIDTCWSIVTGYALVDTIRATDIQARHLLLALEAGEPYRIALALACEAGLSSFPGQKSRRKVERVLEVGRQLARRVNHPHAIAMIEFASGVAAYMQGRWKEGWVHGEEAEKIFRERCTGVTWELDSTHVFCLRALFYLGRISQLSARVPVLIREALERDDLYAATSLRTRHAYVAWLAADDPRKARDEIRDAMSHWSSREFQMQHYFSLVAEAEISLFEGEGADARQHLRDQWAGLRKSLMLRSQIFRVESGCVQARCALSVALATLDPGEIEALLHSAEQDASEIEREELHWGSPLAMVLRAGVASIRGQVPEATRLLQTAEQEFSRADMALYSAVAKRRRGELGGDEGRALVADADEWMRGEGIRNPQGMAAMLAPGRWTR